MTARFKLSFTRTWALIAILPAFAAALNSGPAMPEYNDFEPVDATDMVNLPSGGFSYTVPVATVPGPGLSYPIVLSYHAGITPKQEASWVGLGWNVQAGAITRQVNVVPDDFKGDSITETVKSGVIHGWMSSIGYNGATVGISWDNTHGYGGMVGAQMNFYNMATVGATYGWNGVYGGLGVTLSLGYGLSQNVGMNMSIGYNSRTGGSAGVGVGYGPFSLGANVSSQGASASAGVSLGQGQASLSTKGGLSVGSSAFSVANSISVKGEAMSSSDMFAATLPTPWGIFSFSYGEWAAWIYGYKLDKYYGFLYADKPGMDCSTVGGVNCTGWRPMDDDPTTPEKEDKQHFAYKRQEVNEAGKDFNGYGNVNHGRLAATAEDLYSVAGQGVSGAFKPFRAEDGDYLNTLDRYSQDEPIEDCGFFSFLGCGTQTITVNRPQLLEANRNMLNEQNYSSDVYWRFLDDPAGGEYTDPYYNRNSLAKVGTRSKRVRPYFRHGRLTGFEIAKEDGIRYIYTYPVHAFNETKAGADLTDTKYLTEQKAPGKYAYAWLMTAMLSADYVRMTNGPCLNFDDGKSFCTPAEGDIGGWVAFNYGNGVETGASLLTRWRTPYMDEAFINNEANTPSWGEISAAGVLPHAMKYGPTPFGKVQKNGSVMITSRSMGSGDKEVAYLMGIETPTHTATFTISDREDARSDNKAFDLKVNDKDVTYQRLNLTTKDCWHCTNTMRVEWSWGDNLITFPTDLPSGQSVVLSGSYDYWYEYTAPGAFDRYFRLQSKALPATPTTVIRGYPRNFIQFTVPGMAEYIQGFPTPNPDPAPTPIPKTVYGLTIKVLDQNTKKLKKLDKITIWNKLMQKDAGSVVFGYDYLLTPNTPNGYGVKGSRKLTLVSVKTGATRNGPWMTPYEFRYGNADAAFQKPLPSGSPNSQFDWIPYEKNETDRWGYRCTTCDDSWHEPNGNDANAWNLERIKLPSGASIEIAYEANQIRYVGKEEYFPVVPNNAARRKLYLHQSAEEDISGTTPLKFAQKVVTKQQGYTQRTFDYSYEIKSVSTSSTATNCPVGITASNCSEIDVKYPGGALQRIAVGQSYTGSAAATGFAATQLELAPKCQLVNGVSKTCKQSVKLASVALSAQIDVPATLTRSGGGVRVASVKQLDIYSGKVNTINYAYEDGTTPSLPPATSDYDDSRVPGSMGYEMYQGSPSVMYGKVSATFAPSGIKTTYYFLTPRHLPVFFGKMTPGSEIPNVTVGNQISVNDLSPLWGQMWKKEDFQGTTIVRSETKRWATNNAWTIGYNELPADKKPFTTISENSKTIILVDGEKVIQQYDFNGGVPYIRAANDDQKKTFGLHFNVFGDIYYYGTCTTNPNLASCHQDFIRQTRIFNRRMLGQLAQNDLKQDGLTASTLFYKYDFGNGSALNTWRRNSDGSVQVTSALPAYAKYPAMESSNQLTQEYSATKYFYPATSPEKAYTPGTGDEVIANVVSSTYTAWRPFREPNTSVNVYRSTEKYAWRNSQPFGSITSYGAPTDYCSIDAYYNPTTKVPIGCGSNSSFVSNWILQDRTMKYDVFGHPVESEDANGLVTSTRYGYDKLLPVAVVKNGRYDMMTTQSFETWKDLDAITDVNGPNPAGVTELTSVHSKSGSQSLVIVGNPVHGTAACWNIGTVPMGQIQASAWYFDDMPPLPGPMTYDPITTKYSIPYDPATMIRPLISIGNGNCSALNEPLYNEGNGKWTTWYPESAPTGSRTWKRIKVWYQCLEEQQNVKFCVHNWSNNNSRLITDEWRFVPLGGMMSTYTYDANGSMTSSTDEREITTRYEYDSNGNFARTRNQDGVILTEKAKQFSRR